MKIRLMKVWMTLILGLILLPVAALAQTAEDRINEAFARAEAAGIPKDLLASKLAEGKAKGIDMDRIDAAVQARLEALIKARAAMTKGASDVDAAELSVGADAIGAGVSEAVLAKIAATTGKERRAVAVAALSQLVGQGIPVDTAVANVQDALARGPQALANLAAQSGVGTSHIPDGAGASSTTSGGTSAPTSVPTPGQATPPSPQRGGRGGF